MLRFSVWKDDWCPQSCPPFIIITSSRFYHCPQNCVGEKSCSRNKRNYFFFRTLALDFLLWQFLQTRLVHLVPCPFKHHPKITDWKHSRRGRKRTRTTHSLNSRIIKALLPEVFSTRTNDTEPFRARLYRNVTFNPSLFGGNFHAAIIFCSTLSM